MKSKSLKVISFIMIVVICLSFTAPAFAQSTQPPDTPASTTVQTTAPATSNQIVLDLLEGVIVVVTPLAASWLKRKTDADIAKAKAATKSDQYNMARGIIYDLVQSAKQRGLNEEIENESAKLKEYVVCRAQDVFDQHGLPFDTETIVDLLESAYVNMVGSAYSTIMSEMTQSAPPTPAASVSKQTEPMAG